MPEQEAVPIPVQTSVLIVSHDRCDRLRRCLESLERSGEREKIEILVVDNGSRDGSAQLESEFPAVRFIRLPRNFGLTKALNIGIRAASGEFVFLLHDDTEAPPDAVSRLSRELESRPEAVAVCPALVRPDGEPAPQLRELPFPGQVDMPWSPAPAASEPVPVEYPTGAALMVRRYFLQAMRKIDERYGQYGSDAEICHQIHHAGKEILLIPTVRVVHHGSGEPENEMEAADRELGLAKYIGKHYGLARGIQAHLSAILSALVRFRIGRLTRLVSGQKIDGAQS